MSALELIITIMLVAVILLILELVDRRANP